MLKEVKFIQNIGRFETARPTHDATFDRCTIIFGENGWGKSIEDLDVTGRGGKSTRPVSHHGYRCHIVNVFRTQRYGTATATPLLFREISERVPFSWGNAWPGWYAPEPPVGGAPKASHPTLGLSAL